MVDPAVWPCFAQVKDKDVTGFEKNLLTAALVRDRQVLRLGLQERDEFGDFHFSTRVSSEPTRRVKSQ